MPARTIALGDIHGCSAALAALLDAIQPSTEDTLIALGDYIDRGPDSRGVIEQLLDLGRRCQLVPLLGNHEALLLLSLHDPKLLRCWLSCGGVETLSSYGVVPGQGKRRLADLLPQEHWEFLAGCLPFFETDSHLFLHAGYVPDLPLDQQPSEVLRWSFLDRKKAKPHCSGKVAVVGHTPQRGGKVLDLGFLLCLDTHCHGGGWLTALDVGTGQLWQADQRGRLRRRGLCTVAPARPVAPRG